MLKGKYLFNWLNNGLAMTSPELTVYADGLSIFPSKMTINVPIELTLNGVVFGMLLTDVIVKDFNYDLDQLIERVVVRLDDYKV